MSFVNVFGAGAENLLNMTFLLPFTEKAKVLLSMQRTAASHGKETICDRSLQISPKPH
jgi:hypothetical protein